MWRALEHRENVEEFRTNPWVSEEVFLTVTMCVAALGDTIFGFLFTQVGQKVRSRLVSQVRPVCSRSVSAAPLGAVDRGCDASYVDGDAVFLSHPNTEVVEDRVARATLVYRGTCARHGLTLNFGPGKTDVMFSIVRMHVERRATVHAWGHSLRRHLR